MANKIELAASYRVLEVAFGSSEDVVRQARALLIKVWHPDRYANDPSVLEHAQRKLREVNAAFETIAAAGFPATEVALRQLAPPPMTTFVAHRRVRWWGVFAITAVIGIAGYTTYRIARSPTKAARDRSSPIAMDTDSTAVSPDSRATRDPWAVSIDRAPSPTSAPTAPLAARPVSPPPSSDAAANAQIEHDLVASSMQHRQHRAEATMRLDALVVSVDNAIEARDYERAELDATRIRWPIHDGPEDRASTADYDKIREARLAIIQRHR